MTEWRRDDEKVHIGECAGLQEELDFEAREKESGKTGRAMQTGGEARRTPEALDEKGKPSVLYRGPPVSA